MQRGKHIGKLVFRSTASSRVPPRQSEPRNLDSNSTYLLVGGLGGLGRAQALSMSEHGARRIAFISRFGDARPDAKALLERLRARSDAQTFTGDVSDKSQFQNILAEITAEMSPIRGVI